MFHNWIKNEMYNNVAKKLKARGTHNINILELAVGKGGDMYKWIGINAKSVVGVDINKDSIYGKNGAVNRYVKMLKSKKRIPKITYYVMDISLDESVNKLKELLRGKKFEIISCQFALHYFFKDKDSLNNVCKIISNHISNDGYFIGTTVNGEKLKDIFKKTPVIEKDVYMLKNLSNLKSDNPYGNKYVVSIGEKNEDHYFAQNDSNEYMVDISELNRMMKLYGLIDIEHINFNEWFAKYEKNNIKYKMSETEKEYSFLNFSFVYRRF